MTADGDRRPRGSKAKRILRAALSIAVVVGIFVGVLPRIADMSEVWAAIRKMSGVEVSTLLAATAWNVLTYGFVIVAALPGLRFVQAMVMTMASTAIANTLPGGGALGVGVTYAMLTSWGSTKADIGRYVIVTGVWNTFVKLGMPVVALALLALAGGQNPVLLAASLAGLGALVASVVALVAVMRSDRLARRVGTILGRVASWFRRLVRQPPVEHLDDAAVRFREQTADLLARRWGWLTLATLVSHVGLFLVLLVTLRHVGVSSADVTWAEALAAFAVVRLVSALPITPGGVGVVELGLSGALVAAGGARAPAVAAVLVYRALTYLLPIPFGAVTYVVWRRAHGWRQVAEDSAQPA